MLPVAHLLLLLYMYDYSYLMFFVVYVSFPCLVFVPGLHSFDYCYVVLYFRHEVTDVAGLTSFSFGIEEQDRYVMCWKKV